MCIKVMLLPAALLLARDCLCGTVGWRKVKLILADETPATEKRRLFGCLRSRALEKK
jgi:hypothetical protein